MIKRLDFICYYPNMTIYKDKNGFKSTFGGIFSIILGILALLSIVAFGKELIIKENPSLSFKEIVSLDLKLSFNKVFVAFSPY